VRRALHAQSPWRGAVMPPYDMPCSALQRTVSTTRHLRQATLEAPRAAASRLAPRTWAAAPAPGPGPAARRCPRRPGPDALLWRPRRLG